MRRENTCRPAPGGSPRPRRFTAGLGVAAAVLATLGAVTVAAGPASADTDPTAHNPRSHGVRITQTADGLMAKGWASDPDSINTNLKITALMDGTRTLATTVTSGANASVQKAYGTGPTPAYSFDIPVPAGKHTVCIIAGNVGAGLDSVIGCVATPYGTQLSSSQVAAHSPVGAINQYSATTSTARFIGWTTDPDYRNRPLLAVLYIDGAPAATVATKPYWNEGARPAASGNHAKFDITVPVSTGTHIGCVWTVNVGLGSNTFLGCDAVDTRGPAGTGKVVQPAMNKAVLAEALKHRGAAYVWGATGPKVFDCSGLVLYSYGKQGKTLPRVSEAQALAARLIPASRAVPGDLVFYHDSEGDVYHVGIYAKPGVDFAAIDEQEGVNYQTIWDPSSVTYGSFTHT